jgi:carbon monoxide dehydrogenase subunit G
VAGYRGTLRVPGPADRVFAYLARFSNAAHWDPGVRSGRMVTPEPVGLGSVFELQVLFLGRSIPMSYRIVELGPGRRVVLQANDPVASLDTITVEPTGDGCEVTYEARLTLTGMRRLADPLLGLVFQRIGDRAAKGLAESLALLSAESEGQADRGGR